MKPKSKFYWKREFTYKAWLDMKKTGMSCARWYHSFEAFVDEMGYKPSKFHYLSIKIGAHFYCERNCEWVMLTDDIDVMKAIETFCDPNYIPEKLPYQL